MYIAGKWVQNVVHLKRCAQCGTWSEWYAWKYPDICRSCSLGNLVAFAKAVAR